MAEENKEHAKIHVSQNRIEHFTALTLSIAMLKAKIPSAQRAGDVDAEGAIDQELQRCYAKRAELEEQFETTGGA